MRKFTLCLSIISAVLFCHNISAQLFVSNSSYIYNKGTYVYVKGDVELRDAASNLYLRNEGQLLQAGTTVNGTNKGNGNLSVFQEGTANNYAYNYWCAPVGVPQGATVGNSVFGINQIKRPSGLTSIGGQSYIPGYDGVSTNTTLAISSYWIYKYITGNDYSNWIQVGLANSIAPGEGFTMKGVSGTDNTDVGEATLNNTGNNQRYDFRGVPNEGTIGIMVNNLGAAYPSSTLTGNPYPSAINLNLFLLENSGYVVDYITGAYAPSGAATNVITGTAYFWEQRKTPAPTSHVLTQYVAGYGEYVANGATAFSPGTYNNATWNTFNPDGTVNVAGGGSGTGRYKRMFAPVGQGFLVNGIVAGTAQMKNLYRTFVKESSGNSEFERTAVNSQNFSDSRDPNTIQTSANNWSEIPNVAGVDYTKFSKDEVPQIKIHTILNNEFTKEITLAFNPISTDGYDSAMDGAASATNLPNDAYFPLNNSYFSISTIPFSLEKRIPIAFKSATTTNFKVSVGEIINFEGAENIYLHDKVSGMYYDIKNSTHEMVLPAGTNTTQYEITFINGLLGTPNIAANAFDLVQNNVSHMLTIANPKLMDLKSVALYDITGKLIFSKTNLGTENRYEFSTSGISDSVYIIKIITADDKDFSKKVTIYNGK